MKTDVGLQDERETLSLDKQLNFHFGVSSGEQPVNHASQCLHWGKLMPAISPVLRDVTGVGGGSWAEMASPCTEFLKQEENWNILSLYVSRVKIYFFPLPLLSLIHLLLN